MKTRRKLSPALDSATLLEPYSSQISFGSYAEDPESWRELVQTNSHFQ